MLINIDHVGESVLLHVFDFVQAYRQSRNASYQSDWTFTFNDTSSRADVKILFLEIFDVVPEVDLDHYDIIMLSNHSEPLHVFDSKFVTLLQHDKTYIMANAYLDSDHVLHDRVLWTPLPVFLICTDYWSRPYYPQLYGHHAAQTSKRSHTITMINGQNRAYRKYFLDQLISHAPQVNFVNNFSSIGRLKTAQWETDEDRDFREYVNALYEGQYVRNSATKNQYLEQSVEVGIGGKFGSVHPGFFILPQYYQSACVIFPESGWQNDELNMTEKAAKCWLAGSVPWPIGGRNIHRLYNSLGFGTAWNLLPDDLRIFDQEKNHSTRYQLIVQAVKWLCDNPQVFDSAACQELVRRNRDLFFSKETLVPFVTRICDVIERHCPS